MSLETRIKIVAGIQLVGYVRFWTDVLCQIDISMPVSLLKKLKKKDKVKAYKKEYGQKKEIKRKRIEKVNKQIKRGIEENKLAIAQGKDYKSGIAIQVEKIAQKTVKQLMAADHKKISILPLSKRTCKYYPQ